MSLTWKTDAGTPWRPAHPKGERPGRIRGATRRTGLIPEIRAGVRSAVLRAWRYSGLATQEWPEETAVAAAPRLHPGPSQGRQRTALLGCIAFERQAIGR